MTIVEEPRTDQSHGERRLKMTYEEFLAFGEDTTHAEWVNGEAVILMPPTMRHQDVLRFLSELISLFAQYFGSGKVFFAPFEMKLTSLGSSREPDMLFVAKQHLDRLTPKRLEGPADLVVELISTESTHRDRVDKYDEYEAAGVREYWLIDPRPGHNRAFFYQLDAGSRYQQIALDEAGRYHSSVLPNFYLQVGWLWQDELPATLDVLRQIVGQDKL